MLITGGGQPPASSDGTRPSGVLKSHRPTLPFAGYVVIYQPYLGSRTGDDGFSSWMAVMADWTLVARVLAMGKRLRGRCTGTTPHPALADLTQRPRRRTVRRLKIATAAPDLSDGALLGVAAAPLDTDTGITALDYRTAYWDMGRSCSAIALRTEPLGPSGCRPSHHPLTSSV